MHCLQDHERQVCGPNRKAGSFEQSPALENFRGVLAATGLGWSRLEDIEFW